MDDFLKKIAGVESENKKEKEVEKNKISKPKKEKSQVFHFPKRTQKNQQIKISLDHHKKLKSLSKRKGIPVTHLLEYILNYTFEKYEL